MFETPWLLQTFGAGQFAKNTGPATLVCRADDDL
jgi:hypothetical protein